LQPLTIANGRIGNDSLHEIFLSVLPFYLYSDHAPITFPLKVNSKQIEQNCDSNFETTLHYKRDAAHKSAFRKDVVAKLPQIIEVLSQINTDNISYYNIEQMVDSFSALIQSTADPYLKHYSNCNVYSNCNKE
jgi:hypothetical protein